jgi:hypothetical protein
MQTDYSLYPRRALPGLIADISPHTVGSFAAEGKIYAGAPLVRGADPAHTVKMAAAGQGESVFAVAAYEYKDAVGGALYRDKQTVSALRAGSIYVEVAGEVTPGAPAYLSIDGGRPKFSAAGEALGVGVVFESAAEDGLALVSVGGKTVFNSITEGE